MKKVVLLSILALSVIGCTKDELPKQSDVITPKDSIPTKPIENPTEATAKPAIVNLVKTYLNKTGKSTAIDSTKQRLVYTIREDFIGTSYGSEMKTFYRYDNKGRLIRIEEAQGDGQFDVLRTFEYDTNDVMTKYTDPNHRLHFCSFDDKGRVIGSHFSEGDVADNETVIEYYPNSDRVKSLTHLAINAKITYEYDDSDSSFTVHYFMDNEEMMWQKNWYDNHKSGTYSLEKHNLYDPAKFLAVKYIQQFGQNSDPNHPIRSTKRQYNKWGYLTRAYDEESNNVLIYVYECY